MQRILVTGGAGYVGSICAAHLIERGHEVTIVDDLSTGHIEAVPTQAVFYQMDIGDEHGFSLLLKKHHFDVVFHFAAKALIAESVTDPAIFYRTNVQAAYSMTECLRASGVHRFVFSSTAAVYGNPETTPIPEEHPKNPVNSYGETKLAFERMLRWYSQGYGWSVVAFRYFNACGATPSRGERHEPETHIIPLLLQVASGQRQTFIVYGDDYETPDGTCLRDYVHVLDLAEAHTLALKCMDAPGFRAYNIGTGKSYSVLDMCRVVAEVTDRRVNVTVGDRRPGDPAVLCASPRRIHSELGWGPRSSDLHTIVASAWRWELMRQASRNKLAESALAEPESDLNSLQRSA
ncbi:MAG: UDP-glucose 4-epimerase GalE [Terriglobales bacterium]